MERVSFRIYAEANIAKSALTIRRNKWGQLGENLGGVKFPWRWSAASRLMTSHRPGVSRTNKDDSHIAKAQTQRIRGSYAYGIFIMPVVFALWPYILVRKDLLFMDRQLKRGDMYYANLTKGVGSEQSGLRPVLVVQNEIGNKHSGTVIVAPITSKTERKYIMPTHCRIQAMYGLPRISYILLEQLHTIDKSRLLSYIGTLNDKLLRKINKALTISVGLDRRQNNE